MKTIKEIIKGRPLEERDGVLYFHKPPSDIIPSRDEAPRDMRTWSYWRKENYHFLKEELGKMNKDSVLVDLGAGQSDFLELTSAFKLCAVDLYPYPGIQVVCDLEHSLPFKDKSVDIVLLTNLLEHVREPNAVLEECYRILKPGGMLLGTVPFMIQIHQRPYDFYRYTEYNLEYLFTKHQLRNAAITPVSNLSVLFFNVATSFFTRAIKKTRYKLLWKIMWKMARIKMAIVQKLFKNHLSNPDNPLGYCFKAYK